MSHVDRVRPVTGDQFQRLVECLRIELNRRTSRKRELPVADAEVVFQLPAMGPSGLFPDRSHLLKTKTNSQGQAAATGLVPNDETGRFYFYDLLRRKSIFIAMVIGRSDPRRSEIAEIERQLGPERFSVLFFPGGHQWAPATSFAQALDWIESRARYLKNLRLRFGEVTRSIRSWMPTRKSALYPKKA